MNAFRVMVLGSDASARTAVRDILAAQLPEAAIEVLEPDVLRSRPATDAVVLADRGGAAETLQLVERLRAMGFGGVVVAVRDGPGAADATRFGVSTVPPDALAAGLVRVLAEQLESAASEHAPQVARARKLVAAGEIAIRLQHALNNPLAAILAETQLLQLDAQTEEQQAALERIVGLCRRIVELGRSLDGMSERK